MHFPMLKSYFRTEFVLAALFITIFGGAATHVFAEQVPTREEIMAALAVTDDQLPNSNGPLTRSAAPAEKDPYLLALQKCASDKPDAALVGVLLRYQLAYLSPENPLPAKVIGAVFLEQPETFTTVYAQVPAAGRVILSLYLEFGFNKAIEGRNLSSPKIVVAKKRYDKLQADVMNARSRDDR
jgi:hypothetical protein